MFNTTILNSRIYISKLHDQTKIYKNIVIPATIEGGKKIVYGIFALAFADNNFIEEITIDNGVEFIGKKAFVNCTALEKVTIPASVVKIDTDAFQDCINLKIVIFLGHKPKTNGKIFNGCNLDKILVYIDLAPMENDWEVDFEGFPIENIQMISNTYEDGDIFKEYEPTLDSQYVAEETEYKEEVHAKDRTGMIQRSSKVTSLKNVSNPLEAFRLQVDAIYNSIYTRRIKGVEILSQEEKLNVIASITRVQDIKYKNPAGFIFGAIMFYRFNSERPEEGPKLTNSIMKIIDDTVNSRYMILTPPDLVKYYIFWKNTVSKLI